MSTVTLSRWLPWLQAIRLKTLTAAFVPVLTGTLLARAEVGRVDWTLAFCALLSALFIQMGTNLINDALDYKKGSDTEKRLGPPRVTQSGLLTMQEVFTWGIGCFGLAMVFGIPLIMHGGWPFAVIIFLSACCGYLYTGGPCPLAYCGLGDLFVLLFFGFVATVSVFFLQTGFFDKMALLAGAQIGLLGMVMIGINNFRDIAEDTHANKRTLPVRFGKRFAKTTIALFALLPFLFNLLWLRYGFMAAGYLPWVSFPLATFLVRNIRTMEPGQKCNHFLAISAALHLFFGLLLSLGFYLE